ncbi:hypothetical protein RN001_002794 [Aquatica leii]|uniref:Transposase domain-containing protein n=1 Tax=Aquatica leii TaxID=1421715 RepID=A0AAN7PHP5_9COLE|nr:hypothetical protein RN001_002794 [Aquatica leii]
MSRQYKEIVGRRQFYRRVVKLRKELINDKNNDTFLNNSASTNKNNETSVVSANDLSSSNSTVFEFESSNKSAEYSYNDVNNGKDTLSDKLRNWTIQHNIPRGALTELLHILSPYHPTLPLDSRTLLMTPVTHLSTQKLEKGEFCYFGIMKVLPYICAKLPLNFIDTLELSFNIDGLPIFHSSDINLWPILGVIKNVLTSPFVIGLYCGSSKPTPLSVFLEDFVKELKILMNEGAMLNGKKFAIKIHSFICDAPARAFIKCVKTHSGYASCDKCCDVGEYHNHRVVFTNINAERRSDSSFILKLDEDHHIGESPLQQLDIGMISNFPQDYMHNVCLGVMRKLLHTWITIGPPKVRLRNQNVTLISDRLLSLSKYVPVEFNRKPRSLTDLCRWKATELRTFLLYVGPVVLKDILDVAVYEHFLLFHAAITILLSEVYFTKLLHYSKEFLNLFVTHCKNLYGIEFLVYNVHTLCHITDDVIRFGGLDNFSAFLFENCLGKLKKLIKSPTNVLAQIYRRLHELNFVVIPQRTEVDNIECDKLHLQGPLPDKFSSYRQYKKLKYKSFTLSIKSHSVSDCYYIAKDNDIYEVQNIIIDQNSALILAHKFLLKESFYVYPIDSKTLNVYVVSQISEQLEVHPVSHISGKCFLIPTNDGKVAFPIIHSLYESSAD